MILEFIKHDYDTLYLKLVLISLIWFCVLIAMAIDLGFGIQKAKKIGEFITSEGFRRTIHKVVYYYSMMIFGLLFDFLNPFSYYFPYPISILPIITILFGIVLVYTEAKSVREKAEDKLRRKTDASFIDIVETVKNNKEVMDNLIEFLKNKQNENNNTDSNPPAAN